MFSNFYRLDPHNEPCVAPENLAWSVSKNRIESRSSLDVVTCGYRMRMFGDFVTEYPGPPNRDVHYWVRSSW